MGCARVPCGLVVELTHANTLVLQLFYKHLTSPHLHTTLSNIPLARLWKNFLVATFVCDASTIILKWTIK